MTVETLLNRMEFVITIYRDRARVNGGFWGGGERRGISFSLLLASS